MKYWLVTFQVSRNNRATWQVWNEVTYGHPADWLCDRLTSMGALGYTNMVLLNAIEITLAQADELRKVLE
jgi:hypothetical protein